MGGIKKEYLPLPGSANGLTVLGAAVSAFAAVPEIQTIIITVPEYPETAETAARQALPSQLLTEKISPIIHFVPGGTTRRASVFNALSLLADKPETDAPGYVLIHDGARPWVSPSLIKRIIESVKTHHAVIPLMPLVETPKELEMPPPCFYKTASEAGTYRNRPNTAGLCLSRNFCRPQASSRTRKPSIL
jgi:2-C-methyl-D-erythritol 4-phosphate cytidylyltransferase/2-C-methyl-D-erythritol 4-phosphate cytidylyltransferase/2-C-methyl-D-erythritol 2,4-cyclodiphosphate synthase